MRAWPRWAVVLLGLGTMSLSAANPPKTPVSNRTRTEAEVRQETRTQEREEARTQKRQKEGVFGDELMTKQERAQYRKQLKECKTEEERARLRMEHRLRMQERARLQGIELAD
ncbi:MAG: hypothetical protein IPN65_06580 [Elusimicrobia bacterium]|jgi:hypothetical protein|nr:hypothetical protein [Elusimicrobiota bacterium]MBK7544486.1 hypothetical protein [Elusimicrobiota bacterium]MBK7574009.1 hypothetical protein [Elusimicrobiota bacterium]MBK8126149.1 hypothetical protein [Elusimicrobiota bacterium]MBK9056626.1 hypothetical protein [Elusimicrobiota bacterium]